MIQIKHRMPVSFKTPPTSTDRTELTAAVAAGKTKVALEDRSVKADNNEDNTPMAMYRDESFENKRRQTNVIDHCPHGTQSLENGLKLRGEPVVKAESVQGVSRSLIIQIVLTVVFCILEFLTGVICSSIAMLADSYHMAADVMALIVAFTCIKIATRPSTRHGYGWVRAETLGGFFNGVFMCTVCCLVLQEAVGRLFNAHLITHPLQVMIIGAIGLVINIYGMFNLSGHGHSHGGGGHGHSHGGGGHGHSHGGGKKSKKNKKEGHGHSHDEGHGHSHDGGHGHSHDHEEHEDCHEEDHDGHETHKEGPHVEVTTRLLQEEAIDQIVERRLSTVNNQPGVSPYTHIASDLLNSTVSVNGEGKGPKPEKNDNLRGVWLHLMSDALGSVIVMISSAFVYFNSEWWLTVYLDPILSILLALLMGYGAVKLVKSSGGNLLKRTPADFNVEKIKQDLCSIVGVSKVEKMSIWTLTDQRIIASAHMNFCHPAVFSEAAFKIKKYFHDLGVHSTTIEPTFEPACMQSMIVKIRKSKDKVKEPKQAVIIAEDETEEGPSTQ